MTQVLRPYQRDAVEALCKSITEGFTRVLYTMATGCGKCLGKDTPVLMFDGQVKSVQDIIAGELLMGPDSLPRKVLSTCTGREPLYRVIPVKGDAYVVNESHILSLKLTPTHGSPDFPCQAGRTVNISVRDYLAKGSTFKHRAKGWRTGVEFPCKNLVLDPYILGVWLGYGTSASMAITAMDQEVIDAWYAYAEKEGFDVRVQNQPNNKSKVYILKNKQGPYFHGTSPNFWLMAYGLLGNKHIPPGYLANSRENRLELLAGLIDTDGALVKGCAGYDLIFKSKALADGVTFLARSLGFAAYMKPCRKTCVNTGAVGDYYRIGISGDVCEIPVRIGRKKASARRQKKDHLVTGVRVEPIGEGDYYGFEIDGDGLFLLGDFTVTHNTTTFAELCKVFLEDPFQDHKILILCHRKELIEQAYKRVRDHCGLDEYEIGIEWAQLRADASNRVVVGSVMSVKNKGRLEGWRPTVIISDECFPAGTLVDGRPIESYKVGDFVKSYDHATKQIRNCEITHVFRNPVRRLLRVTLEDGRQITCTPNHPFATQYEYVPASALCVGDVVYSTIEQEGGMVHEVSNVRCVRDGLHAEELEQGHGSLLLGGLQVATPGRTAQESHDGVFRLQKAGRVQGRSRPGYGASGQSLLFQGVFQRILTEGIGAFVGRNESEVRIGAHEGKEPDARSRSQGTDAGNTSFYRPSTKGAGRQREGQHNSTGTPGQSAGVENRSRRTNEHAAQFRIPWLLQAGHRAYGLEDRNRSGRRFSHGPIPAGTGPEEGTVLSGVRVDRIEILEPGSDGKFGGVCEEGYVYNLEVDGPHNYFANGILVHNCHHSAAKSWLGIVDRFGVKVNDGSCIHIGCTATAQRTDRFCLYARDIHGNFVEVEKKGKVRKATEEESVYQKVVYEYSILDAIEAGWLVPIRGIAEETRTDISSVETDTDGDFKEGQLAQVVNNTDRNSQIVSAWKESASDRPTLAFCASVEHAYEMAEVWRQAGYTAAALDGTSDPVLRDITLHDFQQGKIQVLCNMGLFTEGTDIPSCSCIVAACPTKSWNRYVQMVGRGLRVLPGVLDALQEESAESRIEAIAASAKPDCLILDFVDLNNKAGKLCTVPVIIHLPVSLDMQGHSLIETKHLLERFEKVKGKVIGGCPKNFTELEVKLKSVDMMTRCVGKSIDEWGVITGGYRFTRVPPNYKAELHSRDDGGFTLRVTHELRTILEKEGKPRAKITPGYLDKASEYATNAIREHIGEQSRGTLARLSAKQIGTLTRWVERPDGRRGYLKTEIDAMPYAKAKAILDKHFQKRKAGGV